jgi:hypothetical protein
MFEPGKTVVTDMQKFMGVYGHNHNSATSSAIQGTNDWRINPQSFNSPISGKKRNISKADTQDNFSCLTNRAPHRMSNYNDMKIEEEENFTNEPAEMIYYREEISGAMNIDPEIRSKNLVYGLAQDIHQEDLNELQASVRREITTGSMFEVDPAAALKAATDNPPYAWSIIKKINHKLELIESLQRFSTSAIFRNTQCFVFGKVVIRIWIPQERLRYRNRNRNMLKRLGKV